MKKNIAWLMKSSLLTLLVLSACGYEGASDLDELQGASGKNDLVELSLWAVEWSNRVIHNPSGTQSENLESSNEFWTIATEQSENGPVRTAHYCVLHDDETITCDDSIAVVIPTASDGIYFMTERFPFANAEGAEWRDSFILYETGTSDDGTPFMSGTASEAQWLDGEPYAKITADCVWQKVAEQVYSTSSSAEGTMVTFRRDMTEGLELISNISASKHLIP
ncbi:MAG: hypothetical protein IPJ88_07205 [Myxococcales bacterium]|nr:MAG: hypothetical protein IPJ88_07205 [Myxococcales bacterium]